MNLLDDKYEFNNYSTSCDCGNENKILLPEIKGIIQTYTCSVCKEEKGVINNLPLSRSGLHKKTVDLYNAITLEVLNYRYGQMTLRHLFYRLVSKNILQKTEKEYQRMIKDAGNMRRTGLISYEAFADGSRLFRRPNTYDSMTDALIEMQQYYRKSLWKDASVHVEFWCEKDAISDIVFQVTNKYDVSLMVARGFSSLTFLYNSARDMIRSGKPAYVYHVGDFDPSGQMAASSIEQTFRKFGVPVTFKRLCVTQEQIREFNLPTRPTKDSTHSKGFIGDSVEVDAIEPHIIQQLVEDAILSHIDISELSRIKNIEQAEKEVLIEYSKNFQNFQG